MFLVVVPSYICVVCVVCSNALAFTNVKCSGRRVGLLVSLVYTAVSVFFFNDTATTEIYTLSLHDALPIYLWNLQFLYRKTLEPPFSK